MVPIQNRPAGSSLPSLQRLPGICGSTSQTVDVTLPLARSTQAIRLANAKSRRPLAKGATAHTGSLKSRVSTVPPEASQECS